MLTFLFNKTPLFYLVQSFWRDEAFTAVLAKKNIPEIILLTAKDFNPPLYYFLIHLWMNFFGSSEISLRLVSLLFFWGTVYGFYLFMQKRLHIPFKRTIVYLALITINPILVYYAFEARMYSMLAFFAVFSTYSFLQNRKKSYVVFTLLGMYIHYYMIFVLLSQVIYTLWTEKKTRWPTYMPQFLIPVFGFLPWALFVLLEKRPLLGSFWIMPLQFSDLFTIPFRMYTGYEDATTRYVFWPLLLILIALFSLLTLRLKKENKLYFLLSWGIAFGAGVVSLVKPLFLTRYLIFTSPFLLLLVIQSLERFKSKFRIIIYLLLFLLTVHFLSFQMSKSSKPAFNKILGEIRRIANPNDSVYVTSELDYFTALYYFGPHVKIYKKSWDEIPDFTGKALMQPSVVTYFLPTYPEKAFVFQPDQSYTIQANF